jgi:hypothetical protein
MVIEVDFIGVSSGVWALSCVGKSMVEREDLCGCCGQLRGCNADEATPN